MLSVCICFCIGVNGFANASGDFIGRRCGRKIPHFLSIIKKEEYGKSATGTKTAIFNGSDFMSAMTLMHTMSVCL